MDKTAQNQQNPVPSGAQLQNSNLNQPAEKISVSGAMGKEAEKPLSNYIVSSEKLPVIEKEVADAGVQVVSDQIKLTQEHDQIGVKHSLENNTVDLNKTPKIELPLTPEEAEEIVNKNKGGVSMNVSEHNEGVYFMPSIFGLALMVLKRNLFERFIKK